MYGSHARLPPALAGRAAKTLDQLVRVLIDISTVFVAVKAVSGNLMNDCEN